VNEPDIKSILEEGKIVAVVGLSPREERDNHRIAKYLQGQGYRIIPVNPNAEEVLGERSYPDLASVPEPIDTWMSSAAPRQCRESSRRPSKWGARTVWMQQGVIHEEAAARAREAGLQVVMDRCTMVEHRRYFG
jgi:predicted CoA-binding protein